MKTIAVAFALVSTVAFAAPTKNLTCLKQPDATSKIDLQIQGGTSAVFEESFVTGDPKNPWSKVCYSGGTPFQIEASGSGLDFEGFVYCVNGDRGHINL